MEGAGGINFDIFDASGTRVQGWHDGSARFEKTWTTEEVDPATSLQVYPNGAYTIRVTALPDAGCQVIDEISATVNN